MKKHLSVLFLALFLFGCSGNPDQAKDTGAEETETIIVDENLQNLENSTKELIEEAEELASEVDSLIQNL